MARGAVTRPGHPDTRRWACTKCGCTEARACEGGCWWAAYKICSSCATPAQLERNMEIGPSSLWQVQPEGVLTIDQLAIQFKVNPSSLAVRIWAAGIEPDGEFKEGKVRKVTFSQHLVHLIEAEIKLHPIKKGRGRPKNANRKK